MLIIPHKRLVFLRLLVWVELYLHGVADAGSRLLFYGTHGLNEELGRHRGRVIIILNTLP